MKYKIFSLLIVFFFTSVILPKNNIKNKKFKLGILSSWNSKCGIAVYTKNIVDALQDKKIYPKIYSNKFNINNLIKQIKSDRITALNIQYRGGLYDNFNDLVSLLYKLKRRNVKSILTIHCADQDLTHILPLADSVIIHKNLDERTTRTIRNLHFIPMGTPEYVPMFSKKAARLKYGFSESDKIIVTSGFMFKAKEHANILLEMVPFLKKSPAYKVQLLTAFHDVVKEQCQIEYENIQRVITMYGLHDQVIHITDFLKQQELSERIWMSDIGFVWMDCHTNETSAAAKEFIAARIPLIACDSSHFHDLHKGVVKIPLDRSLYARTIFEILESVELKRLKIEIEELYEERRYKNLITRFIQAYKI